MSRNNDPVIEVNHRDLPLAYPGNSRFQVVCPVCKSGLLLVTRDSPTGKVKEYDSCILCGQRVRYLDIAWLRAWEDGSQTEYEAWVAAGMPNLKEE